MEACADNLFLVENSFLFFLHFLTGKIDFAPSSAAMRPCFVELLAWAVAVGTAGGRAPCAALAFDHRGSAHSLLSTRSRLDSVPPGLQGVCTLQGRTNAKPLRGGEASASEQQQQREDELLASLLRLETRSKSDAEEASLSDPMQDVGALDGLSPRMQALLKRYQDCLLYTSPSPRD